MDIIKLLNRVGLVSESSRMEWYPPFRVMRIKVLELSGDWRVARIRLPLNRRTRNTGGFMFGGCQAALADPIAALACSRLFKGYSVWTRAMTLDFLHEGRADLELRFAVDPLQEERIRAELIQNGRSTPVFEFGYYLPDGTRCTKVHNTVAIRPTGYQKPNPPRQHGTRDL